MLSQYQASTIAVVGDGEILHLNCLPSEVKNRVAAEQMRREESYGDAGYFRPSWTDIFHELYEGEYSLMSRYEIHQWQDHDSSERAAELAHWGGDFYRRLSDAGLQEDWEEMLADAMLYRGHSWGQSDLATLRERFIDNHLDEMAPGMVLCGGCEGEIE